MDGIFWIYEIRNKINDKRYIGKATNPRRRWASHISVSRKESKYQKYIHRAINKYGVENFWFRCIDFSQSEKESLIQEAYWIAVFKTNNPKFGYNLTTGGEGESGFRHSNETRVKLSNLAKERIGNKNSFFNKTHSKEAKSQISESKKKITQEQVNFLRNGYKDGFSVRELAKNIGISKAHAYDIINGKYWR